MKVLLVGGFHSLTASLANKLAKNGAGVAILNSETGTGDIKARYTKYTHEIRHVGNVMANFRPDAVIAANFYDDEYTVSDMEVIASQAAAHGIRRLIFLSSTCVYGEQAPGGRLPDETERPAPVSRRGIAFAAAEELCLHWAKASQLQVTILRLAVVYGAGMHDLPLNQWVDSALRGETMGLPADSVYSYLHIDDMTEAVVNILDAGFSPVYNLVSGTAVPASLLVAWLEGCPELHGRELTLRQEGRAQCFGADNGLLRREYDWRERHSLEERLPELVTTIVRDRAEERKRKARSERRARRISGDTESPLLTIENFLLFALVAFLTVIQTATPLIGDTNFVVLYLVLVAVGMTLRQSALSLLLVCGLLVFQTVRDGADIFSATTGSQTLLKAAEYCIIGLTVAYVIHRLRMKIRFMTLEREDLEVELHTVEQFSEDNLRTRHIFENQILEYEVSLPRVISMTTRLDTLEPERIIPETMNVIAEIIGVRDVAAYMIGNRSGRMRLAFHMTPEARSMGQSPLLGDYPAMIEALEGDRVYLNKEMNPAYPSMASGVKINGALAFVFVVWNLPYRKMGLETSNLLTSITRMVNAALLRAYRYEGVLRDERCLPDSAVLRREPFRRMCEARGIDGDSFGDTICIIRGPGLDLFALANRMESMVRETDYLGDGGDGLLLVLLTGTDEAGYVAFRSRLERLGLQAEAVEPRRALALMRREAAEAAPPVAGRSRLPTDTPAAPPSEATDTPDAVADGPAGDLVDITQDEPSAPPDEPSEPPEEPPVLRPPGAARAYPAPRKRDGGDGVRRVLELIDLLRGQ